MSDESWAKIDKKSLQRIVTYYVILSILSFIFLSALLYLHISGLFTYVLYSSMIGAALSSVLGSTLKYLRKIYKKSIRQEFDFEYAKSDSRAFGTKLYFILRPWYSLVLALIICLGFYVMVNGFVLEANSISSSYTLFVIFYSFFIGHNVGNVVDGLDKRTSNPLDLI